MGYLDDVGRLQLYMEAPHALYTVAVLIQHHTVPVLPLAHSPRGYGVRQNGNLKEKQQQLLFKMVI